MSNMTQPHDDTRPEVDALLTDFFQSEMPKPWPQFKAPRQTRAEQPASVWSRYSGRLALAACIALLVAGYLSIAGYFPVTQAPTGFEDATRMIGAKDGMGQKKTQTPRPQIEELP